MTPANSAAHDQLSCRVSAQSLPLRGSFRTISTMQFRSCCSSLLTGMLWQNYGFIQSQHSRALNWQLKYWADTCATSQITWQTPSQHAKPRKSEPHESSARRRRSLGHKSLQAPQTRPRKNHIPSIGTSCMLWEIIRIRSACLELLM